MLRLTDPPSPCVSICRLDDSGLCEGCLRTIDEIAGWGSLDGQSKRSIIERIAQRRRHLEPPRADARATGDERVADTVSPPDESPLGRPDPTSPPGRLR